MYSSLCEGPEAVSIDLHKEQPQERNIAQILLLGAGVGVGVGERKHQSKLPYVFT